DLLYVCKGPSIGCHLELLEIRYYDRITNTNFISVFQLKAPALSYMLADSGRNYYGDDDESKMIVGDGARMIAMYKLFRK
ncbi:6440_t:CDS:2, partial [Funneliformis geosporum]